MSHQIWSLWYVKINITVCFCFLCKDTHTKKINFYLTPTEREPAVQKGFCNSKQISHGLATRCCYPNNQSTEEERRCRPSRRRSYTAPLISSNSGSFSWLIASSCVSAKLLALNKYTLNWILKFCVFRFSSMAFYFNTQSSLYKIKKKVSYFILCYKNVELWSHHGAFGNLRRKC